MSAFLPFAPLQFVSLFTSPTFFFLFSCQRTAQRDGLTFSSLQTFLGNQGGRGLVIRVSVLQAALQLLNDLFIERSTRSVQLIFLFVSEMPRFSFSDRCVGKRSFWLPFEVGNFDHVNAVLLQSIFVIVRDDFSTHGEDDTVCISKERPCAG
jgi:hypothetical protein